MSTQVDDIVIAMNLYEINTNGYWRLYCIIDDELIPSDILFIYKDGYCYDAKPDPKTKKFKIWKSQDMKDFEITWNTFNSLGNNSCHAKLIKKIETTKK